MLNLHCRLTMGKTTTPDESLEPIIPGFDSILGSAHDYDAEDPRPTVYNVARFFDDMYNGSDQWVNPDSEDWRPVLDGVERFLIFWARYHTGIEWRPRSCGKG